MNVTSLDLNVTLQKIGKGTVKSFSAKFIFRIMRYVLPSENKTTGRRTCLMTTHGTEECRPSDLSWKRKWDLKFVHQELRIQSIWSVKKVTNKNTYWNNVDFTILICFDWLAHSFIYSSEQLIELYFGFLSSNRKSKFKKQNRPNLANRNLIG